jgi:hypothetical protein
MPIELEIIRASEFIRVGPRGHFDLVASKAVLRELATACLKRGIQRAMVDLRAFRPGPKPVLTPSDLVSLVSTFHEIGFTEEHRLAVLYHSDPHHRAREFASISRLRGWNVRAFDDFEHAIIWLSAGETADSETASPDAEKVRVRVKTPVRMKAPAKANVIESRTNA